jgi:PEP-CTERM motif
MLKKKRQQKMFTGRNSAAVRVLLAVGCFGTALNASAVIQDDPYYELFPGGGGGGAIGGASSINTICGTSGCTPDEFMEVRVVTGGPTGTGVIQSFLRQMEPNNAGQDADSSGLTTETSYNTNFGTLQQTTTFDNDAQDAPSAGNDWNRAILLSDLYVTDDGFYELFLDLNEPGNGTEKKYIKMDEFELHLSSTGLLHEYDPDGASQGPELGSFDDASGYLGKVFDMDYWNTKAPEPKPQTEGSGFGGLILDNCVGDKGCGSGDRDYLFRIPVSLFETESEGPVYVHLVSGLGEVSYTPEEEKWVDVNPEAFADAGFDEWWAKECDGDDCGKHDNGGEVPVPGTALLFGLGLTGIYARRRKQA